MNSNIDNLIFTLESNVPQAPKNQFIFDRIKQVREQKDLAKQYGIVCTIISLIPRLYMEGEISEIRKGVDEANKKANTIILKLDEIQKQLNQGFEKLELLSYEVGGKEGELIEAFSKRVNELTVERDKEALVKFLEDITKKEDILINEIEKSSAPPEEKEETKKSIFSIRSVIDKVKHPIKSFGKEVTKEIVVTYTAQEIVKFVFHLVLTVTSMATLGVPIPPQILELLTSMIK